MAALVTVPGVAIARVGEWDASTGPFVCTAADLRDAVQAASDPAFRSAILKVGHVDPRFNGPDADGTPALGRLANLRIDDTGEVMLADLVGVPAWLADILPSAYPSRSIEAQLGVVTGEGRSYRMVVTGLALLGETAPAIESLADVAALFEQPTDVDTWVAARAAAATYAPGDAMPETASAPAATTVAASASLDDLLTAARAKAAAETGQMWVWVREVWTDNLILDDDDGRLWRMDWSESNGSFTFGALVPVKVTYTPIAGNVAANAAHQMGVPLRYERGRGSDVSASTPEGEQPVPELGARLRERLGLPADASDDAVITALDAEKPEAPPEESSTPQGETPTPTTHADGMQSAQQQHVTDPEPTDVEARVAAAVEKHMAPVLARLGEVSGELAARKQADATAEKSRVIEAALADGKIRPADRARWETDYDEAPGVTGRILASLQPGTAFPVKASGRAGVVDDSTDAEEARLNAELFGEEVTRG